MTRQLPPDALKLSAALADTLAQPVRGLAFSSDAQPGIRRQRRGRGFRYLDADGGAVTDGDTLARIRKLAIPPAWTDVWICADPDGYLQATGRDARRRKQYRYHPDWTEQRGAGKFQGLLEFGESLPALRRRLGRDLARPGLGRERVLAIVVQLLQLTLIRVGNREYARANGSYGLTTLLNHHVEAVRGRLRFRFRAKGGVDREVQLGSRRLCQLVRKCQGLPGQTLFQYRDEEGNCVPVTSAMVNAYLRERTGRDFTAKHFRTWAATVMAFSTLARAERPDSPTGRKRIANAALREVARYLGNTPAVCRASYVHPRVLEAFDAGELAGRTLRPRPTWRQAEQETLQFLRELADADRAPARKAAQPTARHRQASAAEARRPPPQSRSPQPTSPRATNAAAP